MTDAVNHPDHYGGANNPYEALKVLRAWMTHEQYIGFCRGNVLKYMARAGKKDTAKTVEDLNKAVFYALSEVMAHEEGDPHV